MASSGRPVASIERDGEEATMKQFRCGDVVLGCQWVARNEDEAALFAEIQSHARDAHGMDEVPPEVVDAINRVITEV
jgi:predicted small metal-binding protein